MITGSRMTNVVETIAGKYVYIDTCSTPDHDWETMVFRCDRSGNVESWSDLDAETYSTAEEAHEGHIEMVQKWQKCKPEE